MSGDSWTRATFDRLYESDPDPWRFDSSPYEAAKYADTLDTLDNRLFTRGLELGCANGAMSQRLAARCTELVAVDISPPAIDLAEARCRDHRITFRVGALPQDFATVVDGTFDLIVISELLYFLSIDDIDRLAALVLPVVQPGGLLVIVNWTGDTDTPCTGDQAAECFISAIKARDTLSLSGYRRESYRVDCLAHTEVDAGL